MNHLPKTEFEKAKPVLETGLQVFIDEMKDTRESGIIEILYSHSPMPKLYTAITRAKRELYIISE